jgi:hypothetical protein
MCQQAGTRRTLLNRLRRLGGCLHPTRASVLLAHIFDHQHLGRNVLVALAHFFADAA